MNYPKITHVIYDMDGLLLDTEPFYTIVTQKIVARFGKNFDWTLKAKMLGKKAIDSARILVNELNIPLAPEAYLQEREAMLAELFPSAMPMPGAQRLTRHLRQNRIPQAVATSSKQDFYELKTKHHREWFSLFNCIVTGDDPLVKQGKPAPDSFLAAALKLGAAPATCLVFEDAPAGVQAARAAGMSVIAVPDPNMAAAEFFGADQVLPSLLAFDPQVWGLPPLQ